MHLDQWRWPRISLWSLSRQSCRSRKSVSRVVDGLGNRIRSLSSPKTSRQSNHCSICANWAGESSFTLKKARSRIRHSSMVSRSCIPHCLRIKEYGISLRRSLSETMVKSCSFRSIPGVIGMSSGMSWTVPNEKSSSSLRRSGSVSRSHRSR